MRLKIKLINFRFKNQDQFMTDIDLSKIYTVS